MVTSRRLLSAKVKGFQLEGVSIHKRIKKTTNKKRNFWWEEKRSLGKIARAHQLAYGFLRYLDYRTMEQKTKIRPNFWAIADVLKEHPIGYDKQCYNSGLDFDTRSTLSDIVAALCGREEELEAILLAEENEQKKTQSKIRSRHAMEHNQLFPLETQPATITTIYAIKCLKKHIETFNQSPLMWLLDRQLMEYNSERYQEIIKNVRID